MPLSLRCYCGALASLLLWRSHITACCWGALASSHRCCCGGGPLASLLPCCSCLAVACCAWRSSIAAAACAALVLLLLRRSQLAAAAAAAALAHRCCCGALAPGSFLSHPRPGLPKPSPHGSSGSACKISFSSSLFLYKFWWGPREGKEGLMTTPRLLPIALATPRTNFLDPLAVQCGLRLHCENRDSHISGDRSMLY